MKIIKFSTPVCQPCKVYGPIFQKVASEVTDVDFEEINCFENPDYARSFGVKGVPTTLFLDKDGVELHRVTGVIEETQLKQTIQTLAS